MVYLNQGQVPEQIPVTSEVKCHLLDPRRSGLFGSGVVRKHIALKTRQYSIESSIHPRIRQIIRRRIMPTVAQWTQGQWEEVPLRSPLAFNWVEHIPSAFVDYGGLAIPGGDATLNNYQAESGREMPEEIVYNNGLHEAAHALFHAVHSNQGLMCINPSCFNRNLKEQGFPMSWNWPWRGPVSLLEHQAYTVYCNPLFLDGMTVGAVESKLVVTAEEKQSNLPCLMGLIFMVGLLILVLWSATAYDLVQGPKQWITERMDSILDALDSSTSE